VEGHCADCRLHMDLSIGMTLLGSKSAANSNSAPLRPFRTDPGRAHLLQRRRSAGSFREVFMRLEADSILAFGFAYPRMAVG
jgi:hypothetical protein